ncbi:hypothetical protein OEA41_006897 [Lepraria neglecta]|uniref:Uncharacterized protein n=1 Tax=Lepraria neglecta TaxID=209136 RepID=A0AAD9Z8P0_9LECA|nr:hypothetical protein OEA41_006897 [Lepraria neglecta]
MLGHFFPLLAYSAFALSSPHQLDGRQLSDTNGDPDLTGTVYIPTPSTSIVFAATTSTTTNPNMTDPIDIKKFFDVSTKCKPAHQAFYKKAYEGAVAIADAARKWPVYGTAESDLYFGSNAEDNPLLVYEVPENMHRASEWSTGDFGFDDYMVLRYKKNKKQLDMRFMVSSASTLLHEMMHAYRLTLNRRRIIDITFDGVSGKRIYGPMAVAKAARIYGSVRMGTNADGYAMFANAMYWNQRLGSVPQPSLASVPAPANYVDGVSDAEDSYLVLVDEDPQLQMNDGSPTNAVIDKLATPLPAGQEPVLWTVSTPRAR